MSPPKHRATAPVTPSSSQKKSGNFFSRHLGRRRKSSVSLPNGHAISSPSQGQTSPSQSRSAARKASVSSSNHDGEASGHHGADHANGSVAFAGDPKSAAYGGGAAENRKPISHVVLNASSAPTASTAVETERTESRESNSDWPKDSGLPSENNSLSPPQSPRQGSKSGGVRWAPGFSDEVPTTRPRRTSSAGTAGTRRGSIYLRGTDGLHIEGVDAGVGSKARRLSVHIPERMEVNECLLSEHFSMLARANKKDIGEGGAAVVRLMQSKTAGTGKDKVFAVKEFREWDREEEDEMDYMRKIKSEYAIAKSCEHPNIVETYRLCTAEKDRKWFHVMQYCEGGDLNDLITAGCFARPEDRNCMFKQLLRGVEYLHKCGIAHRDLKSENLLITKDGCLKIADFGTAEVFCGTHPGLRGCRRPSIIDDEAPIRLCSPGLVGSRPYMAPEIIKHKDDYDPRGVDIWSCAIVYISLCIGGTPWECASVDVKNYNIYCNTWDDWLAKYPDGILQEGRSLPAFAGSKQFMMLDDTPTKRMVMGMLHPDPVMRWSAKDALETKTVTEYPCCQQQGYSDDIKTRQRKAMHNHLPQKKSKFLKPGAK